MGATGVPLLLGEILAPPPPPSSDPPTGVPLHLGDILAPPGEIQVPGMYGC
jgi:hypothetical protein